MNKTSIALIAFLLLGLAVPAPAAFENTHTFQLSVSAGPFFSSASNYRNVYGDSALLPEIGLAYSPWKAVFLWTDLGFLSQDGCIHEFDEAASVSQFHLALGLGYRILDGRHFRLSGLLGLALLRFNEQALGTENSQSALGCKLGLQADYAVSGAWFVRLAASFRQAKTDNGDLSVKLGGFSLGVGLGIAF